LLADVGADVQVVVVAWAGHGVGVQGAIGRGLAGDAGGVGRIAAGGAGVVTSIAEGAN